ncbi:MAG: hydroxymyristoyl-ACP dehydratase [Rubrivivax sp.]|nr:hydroxymyristoyl-ACP dehydratase [Rubrivivax sp.]
MNGATAAGRAPATLDHAGIAARVPHSGAMCLLDRLLRWDAGAIECSISGHADARHPLRDRGADGRAAGNDHGRGHGNDNDRDLGLPASAAIEYAAQAMALHAALAAGAGAPPTPGFLASARGVQLHVRRLDTAKGPLSLLAERLAGDERQAMYRFALRDADGGALAEGRATVVLNSPLPAPAAPQGPGPR